MIYFFEWYAGFLSCVYAYIVEENLHQPIATLFTGILAVIAVVVTQRGFNERQKKTMTSRATFSELL